MSAENYTLYKKLAAQLTTYKLGERTDITIVQINSFNYEKSSSDFGFSRVLMVKITQCGKEKSHDITIFNNIILCILKTTFKFGYIMPSDKSICRDIKSWDALVYSTILCEPQFS